ncbi:hypothetical protein Taro_047589 [Colocasia esculenta]|uniref:Uncharacterized protein n=1 Tax=Colocasia esculenta TaxID=4460 RepID=A0A843WTB9_COLES|nr:hypothetical protein [Colocasia esculenta]
MASSISPLSTAPPQLTLLPLRRSTVAAAPPSRSRGAPPPLASTSAALPLLGRRHVLSSGARVRRLAGVCSRATDQGQQRQQGQFRLLTGETKEEVADNKILQYCSLDKKADKKSLGELEQEFLQALQAFYYEKKAIMSNEEFDNLKEELMWEGSSVVMLSPDEQKLLEASMAYAAGNPIITDAEFDELKLRLKVC